MRKLAVLWEEIVISFRYFAVAAFTLPTVQKLLPNLPIPLLSRFRPDLYSARGRRLSSSSVIIGGDFLVRLQEGTCPIGPDRWMSPEPAIALRGKRVAETLTLQQFAYSME
ncbi:hypothetical protein TcasGA2_TC013621 [Tribolium castaneum]|uniref:Uncharacterized protein n=1 Tax=Tribolium castaneum TaxID=7070 RepID=D6W6Y3_TRICA|nr:hypothetical protein TcasGA2_TC013621 [Tribolium castaneum]